MAYTAPQGPCRNRLRNVPVPAGDGRTGPQPGVVEDGRCGRRIAATIGETRRGCAGPFVHGGGWEMRPDQRSTCLPLWRSGRRWGPRNRIGGWARRGGPGTCGRRCRARRDSWDSTQPGDCTGGEPQTCGRAGVQIESARPVARWHTRVAKREDERALKSGDERGAARPEGIHGEQQRFFLNTLPVEKVTVSDEIGAKRSSHPERTGRLAALFSAQSPLSRGWYRHYRECPTGRRSPRHSARIWIVSKARNAV